MNQEKHGIQAYNTNTQQHKQTKSAAGSEFYRIRIRTGIYGSVYFPIERERDRGYRGVK